MAGSLSKLICLVSAAVLPSPLAVVILRVCGHRIGPECRIGFSLLWVDRMFLQGCNRIGHFNLIACKRLCIGTDGYIGRANAIAGPLSILLRREGAIGNSNKVVRGSQGPVTIGPASLRIGRLAKITAEHRIDCTRSVSIGDYSTLAGVGIQVWTHGYIHETIGPGRYRIDGPVAIANNVYIGASCIISMGTDICAGVIVGAGTTIARSIDQPGLYVSSAIRQLPRPADPAERRDLVAEVDPALSERVYVKRPVSEVRATQ
ncbi:acetyltransferase-like isoleucine patch superfamily enzyme [Paucibacter oligotrophus]|uniref:Acetyltransferase-like isoleucine patch superfamily enzyme n=1 Tax=Roseateles oligotrophus TaxID=1769250 RepID=A0A840L6J0_9BURK|nr:hypothetical protein [Roseateles oligotrophus]MBB4842423.1 acetyltransferase-like isoleucine patch superfamily enzyme [Roseateles oligotrophus]